MTVVGEVRGGEAFIPLTLEGRTRSLRIDAVVDTGFNGQLVLPPELMSEFGYGFAERAGSTLADGTTMSHAVMAVHLRIGRLAETVDAIEMGSEPLVGMALLEGQRLAIDVVEGGRVTVKPLGRPGRSAE